MKRMLALTLFAASLTAAPAWAAAPSEAPPPKPSAKATASPRPAPGELTPAQRAQMEKQIASMQEIHEKFMAAKTPEERAALMDEHMRTMQAGMSMMREMHGGPPMGRGMGRGMGGGMGMGRGMGPGPGQGCMETCMQSRMDMMEMMMQMMMDRAAAVSGK
ncbi:MAG: hypothetical protein KGL40_03975 [Rhodocyclaceae bacterium]|nr:hypothetical protein [Rhodocyclaceae bacterium]